MADFNNHFLLNSRKIFLEHCSMPFISKTTKRGMNKMFSLKKTQRILKLWSFGNFFYWSSSFIPPRPQLVCFRLRLSQWEFNIQVANYSQLLILCGSKVGFWSKTLAIRSASENLGFQKFHELFSFPKKSYLFELLDVFMHSK